MEEVQLRAAAEQNEDNTKVEQTAVTGGTGKEEATGKNVTSRSSKSPSHEQDLDTFLLGDLEDSDDGPGILLSLFRLCYRKHSLFKICIIRTRVLKILHIMLELICANGQKHEPFQLSFSRFLRN